MSPDLACHITAHHENVSLPAPGLLKDGAPAPFADALICGHESRSMQIQRQISHHYYNRQVSIGSESAK